MFNKYIGKEEHAVSLERGASEAGATPHIFGALFHEVVHEQLLTKKNMPLDLPTQKHLMGQK